MGVGWSSDEDRLEDRMCLVRRVLCDVRFDKVAHRIAKSCLVSSVRNSNVLFNRYDAKEQTFTKYRSFVKKVLTWNLNITDACHCCPGEVPFLISMMLHDPIESSAYKAALRYSDIEEWCDFVNHITREMEPQPVPADEINAENTKEQLIELEAGQIITAETIHILYKTMPNDLKELVSYFALPKTTIFGTTEKEFSVRDTLGKMKLLELSDGMLIAERGNMRVKLPNRRPWEAARQLFVNSVVQDAAMFEDEGFLYLKDIKTNESHSGIFYKFIDDTFEDIKRNGLFIYRGFMVSIVTDASDIDSEAAQLEELAYSDGHEKLVIEYLDDSDIKHIIRSRDLSSALNPLQDPPSIRGLFGTHEGDRFEVLLQEDDDLMTYSWDNIISKYRADNDLTESNHFEYFADYRVEISNESFALYDSESGEKLFENGTVPLRLATLSNNEIFCDFGSGGMLFLTPLTKI